MPVSAMAQPNLELVRKASKICMVTGIYLIASSVVSVIIAVLEVLNALLSSYPLGSTPNLSSFTIASFVLSCITVFFVVFFSYYTFKIGRAYDSSSLRAGGVLFLTFMLVGVFVDALSVLGIINVSVTSVSTVSFASSLAVTIVELGLTLAAYICLIVGAANMKNKTGIDSFNTAMILFILFLIPFLFPIGLIIFGQGLGKLARLDEKRVCPRCGKDVDPYALFCRYCGAKL